VAVARRRQGFAQTSDGRALVRRGTRDDIAFGADLQRLINERSVTRFESTELEVPIEDVDPAALDRVRASLGWETVPRSAWPRCSPPRRR
jgi:hypothetical protein